MAGTEVVWTDLMRCPQCSSVNDARDEWCESCLADIPSERSSGMFVRRWSHRPRSRKAAKTLD